MKNIEQLLPCITYESIIKKNMATSADELTDLLQTKLDISNDYPFLNHEQTIEFIKSSKVMFINRGLPGSGKSTLSKKISSLYGFERSVICAGDDFFTDSTGKYVFDSNKLEEAHAAAREKAINACKDSLCAVIIDNTNVTIWEVRNYTKIAREYKYIVLIIEPRTSFKFDSEVLFKTNKHNVPKETINKKLKNYQTIIPYYFGWFLNLTDSANLVELAKKTFNKCVEDFKEFSSDLKSIKKINLNQIYDYKENESLHCTSKFYGRVKQADAYLSNPNIALNTGKVFNLEIIGFSITERTLAAIVAINDTEQKGLWGNDFDEQQIDEMLNETYFKKSLKKKKDLLEKIEFADKAHITIGLAESVQAAQSGHDSFNLKLRLKLNDLLKRDLVKYDTDDCQFIYLGDCYCFAKLKRSIFVPAIFSSDL